MNLIHLFKKTLAFAFGVAVASGPVQGLGISRDSYDGEIWRDSR